MKHTIYTVDIAHVPNIDTDKLLMAFDALLADYPVEFEDWKAHIKTEERTL